MCIRDRGKSTGQYGLDARLRRVRVRAEALAARGRDDVHKSAVVLQTLLRAACQGLAGLLALGDLRGLATHLTGTSERSVDLSLRTQRAVTWSAT